MGAVYALDGNVPLIGLLALISFASIPFAYLYIAYRRQVGGLEVRVNRIASAYLFIVLVGTVEIPLFAMADRWLPSPDDTLIAGMLGALLTAVLSIWAFPRFQGVVEKYLLGISIPPEQAQHLYSTASPTAPPSTN